MKVLILAPWYPDNNNPHYGTFIHEQVKALKRINPAINIDVIKVVPYAPRLLAKINKKYKKYLCRKEYKYEGVNIKTVKVIMLPRNLNIPYVCKSLAKKIIKYLYKNQMNYDIIHAHGAVHTGYAAVKACIKHNIKSVVTVHGSDIMYYADLNKSLTKISNYILSNADLLIAVSNGIEKLIYSRRSNANVKVLYTGIDLNRFNIKERRENQQNKKIKIIFIGNILYSKGVFELIQAFYNINKIGYNCELTFCGTGKDEKKIKNICKENNIKNVFFLGVIENEKIPEILSNHDILVLPSHREGLGTVLLEALAMGKLVVGSNVGGIPEVICDGINGYLFEAKNVDSLTKSLEKAINNYKNLDPFFLRRTIQDKFNINDNARELYKMYNDLLSQKME